MPPLLVAAADRRRSPGSQACLAPLALGLALSLSCAPPFAPPIAVVQAPESAHVGVAVQLDGSASAPAPRDTGPAPVLSFDWTFRAKPAGSAARFSDPHGVAPRFTPDAAGDYVVRLVVADFAHHSAPVERTISVASDCVPHVVSVTASPAAASAGEPVKLLAAAVSPCDVGSVGKDPLVRWRWTLEERPRDSQALVVGPDRPSASLVPDVRGTYVLSAAVTDALGNTSDPQLPEARVTLAVRACGDNPPELRALSALPAAPRTQQAVQLFADVIDRDADASCGLARTLTFAWTLAAAPAGSLARLNDPGARTPSLTPDVEGTYTVGLVVTDELGRASQRLLLPVAAAACGGARPVASIQGPASLRSGGTAQLVAVVQDLDTGPACGLSNTYSYDWRLVAAPLGSRAALSDPGLQNPSFVADAPGTYGFSLVVVSSNGHSSDPAQLTLDATACGAALPSLSVAAVTGAVSGRAVQLQATLDDPNEACATVAPFTFRWELVGRPPGSRAALSGALADGSSARATPSFTPDLGGPYVVDVEAVDALGLHSPRVRQTVAVSECRAPLSVSIAPASGVTRAPLSVTASIDDPNAPGPGSQCTLPVAPFVSRWALVAQPKGSAVTLHNPASAVLSFTPDVAGDYALQLLVVDAQGNEGPVAARTVRVDDCSAPLLASFPAAPPWAGVGTGAPVTLSVDVTNSNDAATACGAPPAGLSYQWTLLSAPGGSAARLRNSGTARPSLLPDLQGPYLVSVVVTDAAGNRSAPAVTTLTAAPCTAPLGLSLGTPGLNACLTGTPILPVLTGAGLVLCGEVIEPNAPGGACTATTDPLRYSWTLIGRPAGSQAALNSSSARSPTLIPDLEGSYRVSLQVTDAAGNQSALVSQDILAAGCTRPLTLSIPAQGGLSTRAPIPLSTTAPPDQPGAGTCGSTTPFSYRWRLDGAPQGSQASIDDPTAAAPAFTPDVAGTYTVSVLVTDALGNRGTARQSYTVSSCASSGSVGAVLGAVPLAPEVGQRVTLSAAPSDANAAGCGAPTAAPFGFLWSLESPAGSGAQLDGARLQQPSFTPDVAGAYRATLTLTDALGASVVLSSPVVTATAACAFLPSITAPATAQLTFSTVSLAGVLGGSCANPSSVAWTFDAAPAGSAAVLVGAQTLGPSLTLDVPNGTWKLRLTVTDLATGVRSAAIATVTSNDCGSQAPLAAAGISLPFPIKRTSPQPDPGVGSAAQYLLNAVPAYQLQLDGTGSSDPSAACTGPLEYEWSVYARPLGSKNVLQPSAAARPVFTPDAGIPGDYTFQLVVRDGRFASAPSYLRITVQSPLQDFAPGVPTGRHVRWNDSAVDPLTGNPSLAWFQRRASGTIYDLFFTRCTADCSTAGGTWTAPETVESNLLNDGDSGIDMAQVSLKWLQTAASTYVPAVAYRRTTSCDMRYAVRKPDGTWFANTIEGIGGRCTGVHGEIDLLLVGTGHAGTGVLGGTPAAAYHTHSPSTDARYAVCTANCASTTSAASWAFSTISTNGNIGHFMTTFADPVSRRPRAAYQENNSTTLYYSTCAGSCDTATGSAANGTWTEKLVVDGSGLNVPTGFWNSMAINSVGRPSIAFEQESSGAGVKVRLATCSSAAVADCGDASKATWSFLNIASFSGIDTFPRLQFDAQDLARITFIDASSQKLRYAVFSSPTLFTLFDIDTQVDDGHSSFILTPTGSTHVSYALTTGLKYYPFGD